MSMMASTCSMSTGHSSTQAPQVVQDQSTSGSIVVGTKVATSLLLVPDRSRSAEANMFSRSPMMSNFGLSGLPVVQAGQTDWQRPHSVQVAKSSICFQVKSSILPAPKTVSSLTLSISMSGVLSRPPSALGRRETPILTGAKKMCRCLEKETKTRKPLMTATLAIRKNASSTLLTPVPKGCSQLATILLAKAHGDAASGMVLAYVADPRATTR